VSSRNYDDDPTIEDSEEVWRRIPEWHCVPDENRGGLRPSSAAFKNDPDESPMSVFLETVMKESGRPPEEALQGHENFALCSLSVGILRELKQSVVRDPLPEEPAHGLVAGDKPRSVSRKMQNASRWLIPPPQNQPTPQEPE